MNINYFLPSAKGPGFNSTPDIINSFWVTLDKTNRYDNKMNDSIREFVFNLVPKDDVPILQINLFPEKVPILERY